MNKQRVSRAADRMVDALMQEPGIDLAEAVAASAAVSMRVNRNVLELIEEGKCTLTRETLVQASAMVLTDLAHGTRQ